MEEAITWTFYDFVSSEEVFLLQLQQDMYWLLLFIPKTVASNEVDVRGSVLVRGSFVGLTRFCLVAVRMCSLP